MYDNWRTRAWLNMRNYVSRDLLLYDPRKLYFRPEYVVVE